METAGGRTRVALLMVLMACGGSPPPAVSGAAGAAADSGWATLRGWGRVAASWFAIFRNPARLQVILTEPEAQVCGDMGWVSVNENLLGGGLGGTVAALNIYVRTPEGWRMVVHHGSTVAGS